MGFTVHSHPMLTDFFANAMKKKTSPTLEAARGRNNRVLFLDHAELCDDDLEWLQATERLTLWCVKVPDGLLAQLKKLWWLDIRGGTGTDLKVATGVTNLKFLAVNQIRGMRDLSVVCDMTGLRYILFYGLPKV